MSHAFMNGLLLAFGLILPLGAQNTFILNQSSQEKHYYLSLPVILVACLCDTLLILLAVLGLSMRLFQFVWVKWILLVGGVLFMLSIGWNSWKAIFDFDQLVQSGKNSLTLWKKIQYTLSVSILNPYAISDTIGVIGTSSLLYSGSSRTLFALGCIVSSWVWFFSLAGLGRLLRRWKTAYAYQGKVSALIIWANAVVFIWNARRLF